MPGVVHGLDVQESKVVATAARGPLLAALGRPCRRCALPCGLALRRTLLLFLLLLR